MKPLIIRKIGIIMMSSILLYSCTKSVDLVDQPTPTPDPTPVSESSNPSDQYSFGLLAMDQSQWASVPVFSESFMASRTTTYGQTNASLPTNYLLATPTVRDQGQIGSCTGFCGAETNEILAYYKANPLAGSFGSGLTVGTGLNAASTTSHVVNSSLFGTSSALSPLFIYYVERVVINKQAITADGGAYMVNIPQALQGLSNNTGTGTALTATVSGSTYTFSGDSYENLYPYPTNGLNTSAQYKTAPSAAAITNAANFKLSVQNGTTGSTGTTSSGYYVINSTNRVNDVKVAVSLKKPVMMGFNVYDNTSYKYFEGLGVLGYAPTNYTYNPLTTAGALVPGLKMLGGHAVPIVGYIDDATQPGGGVFICQNSWSTNWGFRGYFYMPYSVLQSTQIVPAGNLYVATI